MKIRIHSGERSLSIVLPTRLLFSKGAIKLGLKIGRRYSNQVPDIPPEAVDALCAEIRRIKKQYGSWELVNIQSADGEYVQVYL